MRQIENRLQEWHFISTWIRPTEHSTSRNARGGDSLVQSVLQYESFIHTDCAFLESLSRIRVKRFLMTHIFAHKKTLHEMCSGFLLRFQKKEREREALMFKQLFSFSDVVTNDLALILLCQELLMLCYFMQRASYLHRKLMKFSLKKQEVLSLLL